MSVHVCKQCGLKFEYCRACVFRPVRFKDMGFCSKNCYEASKNIIKEVVPTEDVEVVVIEKDTSTPIEEASECPYFFTETIESAITPARDDKQKKKKIKIVEEVQKENNIDESEQNYGHVI